MKIRMFCVIWTFLLVNSVGISVCSAEPVTAPFAEEFLRADLTAVVKSVLQEHPELVLEALKEKPVELANLVQQASITKAIKAEEERRLLELKEPKVPTINVDRPIRGNREAAITIVEYSDFECPFCRSASTTVEQVLKQYGDQVRFVYKHNPLNFHPMAESAARYFEAIAMQDVEEAWRFHDRVFSRQENLADGENELKTIVAALSIDTDRLAQDLNGETVEQRLSRDRKEAERFGFDGTPAFLINGISLMGSQPKEDFEDIVEMFIPDGQEKKHVVAQGVH